MDYSRFCLYKKNYRCGIMDRKTGRIIINHCYEVEGLLKDEVEMSDGRILSLEDLLHKCDSFHEGERFSIVENIHNEKVGIFDNRQGKLVVPCQYDRINYLSKGEGFLIVKKRREKKISYEKLQKMRYHSLSSKIIVVKDLSIYYAELMTIDLRRGERVKFMR